MCLRQLKKKNGVWKNNNSQQIVDSSNGCQLIVDNQWGGIKMSKYKIELKIKREDDIIDLVEDYGYTEEEAEEI